MSCLFKKVYICSVWTILQVEMTPCPAFRKDFICPVSIQMWEDEILRFLVFV